MLEELCHLSMRLGTYSPSKSLTLFHHLFRRKSMALECWSPNQECPFITFGIIATGEYFNIPWCTIVSFLSKIREERMEGEGRSIVNWRNQPVLGQSSSLLVGVVLQWKVFDLLSYWGSLDSDQSYLPISSWQLAFSILRSWVPAFSCCCLHICNTVPHLKIKIFHLCDRYKLLMELPTFHRN